jgi:hypothetical protein
MTDLRPAAGIDLGRVVSRAFAAIGANFPTFFLLVFVFSALPSFAITFAVGLFAPGLFAPAASVAVSLLGSLVELLASIPSYVAVGAVTHGAIVSFNGGRADLGDCLSTGIRNLLPLIVVGFLTSIAVILGMVALIVPGIVMAIVLSVTVPVLVVEKRGIFGSMSRSAELTKGNRDLRDCGAPACRCGGVCRHRSRRRTGGAFGLHGRHLGDGDRDPARKRARLHGELNRRRLALS